MAGERANPGALPQPLFNVCLALVGLGAACFVFGLMRDPQTAWLSFHSNFIFFTMLSCGAMALAAAYSFVDNDPRMRPLGDAPSDGGSTDTHTVTADMVFHVAGWSVTGDFFWRQGRRNPGNAVIDDGMGGMIPAPVELARNGLGWTAQTGFLIPKVPLELAGRYSGIRRLGSETSLVDLDEVGPGLSYYFAQHALKLQLDYFHQLGVVQDRVRLQLTFSF